MQPKYISIDIETTGLNSDKCQIIQFGAVIDDFITPIENLPKLNLYVLSYNNSYYWELYAYEMNFEIFQEIKKMHKTGSEKPYVINNDLKYTFYEWLIENNYNQKILIAGKNFAGFDKHFLDKLNFFDCDYNDKFKFSRRYLDVGSMYYNPKIDCDIPDLTECAKRAGFKINNLHQAIDDAITVVKCIRSKYGIEY